MKFLHIEEGEIKLGDAINWDIEVQYILIIDL
jgi:hypothetical protein